MIDHVIRPLNTGDLQDVMEVFKVCFAGDEFYSKAFAEEGITGQFARQREMQKRFTPQIKHVLEFNLSYGSWVNDRLIAFMLNFDYERVVSQEPELFRSLFYDGDTLPFAEHLHRPIREACRMQGVMFMLSIGVLPEFRRQHVASSLLDTAMEKNPYVLIASDVSNTASLGMYKQRKFSVTWLDEDYHLVIGPGPIVGYDEVYDAVGYMRYPCLTHLCFYLWNGLCAFLILGFDFLGKRIASMYQGGNGYRSG